VIPVLVTPARLTAPGRLKLGARAVTFTLRCQGSPGQRCKGTALLRVTRNASKTLTVGKLAFVVNAGASKSVTVKLNRVGRKLLARLHVLKARLTVTAASGGTILNKKIRFRR
jgi:hypothetical protein